ncbi:MAG TPA: hypothetical protein VJ775_06015 [Sphingomicrobium sp.]|nr:hypothetical protein [Sphingomicrobium sp.]
MNAEDPNPAMGELSEENRRLVGRVAPLLAFAEIEWSTLNRLLDAARSEPRSLSEEMVEAAYREGYRNGFVDANFADSEEDALRKIDSIALLDGWNDSRARAALQAALGARR